MGSNVFQTVLLVIFGVLALGGIGVFALGSYTGNTALQPVVIWGTLDSDAFEGVISALAENNEAFRLVTYKEVSPTLYQSELATALAGGTGPDLFITANDAYAQRGIIGPLTYDQISKEQFAGLFVDGAQVFDIGTGFLGIPFLVDPYVLYYNKDTLSSAGYASATLRWKEVHTMADVNSPQTVTVLDEQRKILKSTIAFGEFVNVASARGILAALIFQAGGSVTTIDERGLLRTDFVSRTGGALSPGEGAFRFFTDFANPSKDIYTWNRSMPEARDAFAAGDVALYVGPGSEAALIRAKNPNLHFGIDVLPQLASTTGFVTYGDFYIFAVPRASYNVDGALMVAKQLVDPAVSSQIAAAMGMVSANRGALAQRVDGDLEVLRRSALFARTFLDPRPASTLQSFRSAITDTTSGALDVVEAVARADREISSTIVDN